MDNDQPKRMSHNNLPAAASMTSPEKTQLAKPNISQTVKRNPHRQLPARFLGSFRQYCPCSDFTVR